MHMESALISTTVAGAMALSQAGTLGYSVKSVKNTMDKDKIRLMAGTGAFVFAAQMMNFSIPGTGSSGHFVGGIMLAALLGPNLAFLVMSVILGVQAVYFGDGGIMAYGCNLFNMGFISCYIAYPLILKPLYKEHKILGSMIASVVALQLGAFSVVLQTALSGITELPFGQFAFAMQPIHLAIGIVEGIITAGVLCFIQALDTKKITAVTGTAAAVIGGFLSFFASGKPDGLEWSIGKITGSESLTATDSIHTFFMNLQNDLAIMQDYNPLVLAGFAGCLLSASILFMLGKLMNKIKI